MTPAAARLPTGPGPVLGFLVDAGFAAMHDPQPYLTIIAWPVGYGRDDLAAMLAQWGRCGS